MTRYQANPEVEITRVEDDLFLVYPGGESIHHLNSLGAGIWRLLDQPIEFDDITGVLAGAFPDIPEKQLKADALEVLKGLVDEKLVLEAD